MYELNNLKSVKHYRRKLRNKQTKAEKILWGKIKKKQLGYKFRRQHSFGKYILDFYCPSIIMAIELDGSVHGKYSQRVHDKIRTRYLEDHFIKVVRFRNEEVYNELDSVIIVIIKEIKNQKEFLSSIISEYQD